MHILMKLNWAHVFPTGCTFNCCQTTWFQHLVVSRFVFGLIKIISFVYKYLHGPAHPVCLTCSTRGPPHTISGQLIRHCWELLSAHQQAAPRVQLCGLTCFIKLWEKKTHWCVQTVALNIKAVMDTNTPEHDGRCFILLNDSFCWAVTKHKYFIMVLKQNICASAEWLYFCHLCCKELRRGVSWPADGATGFFNLTENHKRSWTEDVTESEEKWVPVPCFMSIIHVQLVISEWEMPARRVFPVFIVLLVLPSSVLSKWSSMKLVPCCSLEWRWGAQLTPWRLGSVMETEAGFITLIALSPWQRLQTSVKSYEGVYLNDVTIKRNKDNMTKCLILLH